MLTLCWVPGEERSGAEQPREPLTRCQTPSREGRTGLCPPQKPLRPQGHTMG